MQDPASKLRDLFALLDSDPCAYHAEIARLRREEPERFDALIECMRGEVERSNEREDRPLTSSELDEMVSRTARELCWSRERVIAEGVLRLRQALRRPGFSPVTPETDPDRRSGKYQRRRSSMEALLVGDVDALLKKHGSK